MLVLARYPDQDIYITLPDGRFIRVVVAHVQGKRAMIGIDAPRDCKILRGEFLPKPTTPPGTAGGSGGTPTGA